MGRLFYAGADLRVDPFGENDWSPERRARYLLRSDVGFPLSIDTAVWARAVADLPLPLPWIPIGDVQRQAGLLSADHRVSVAIFGVAAEDDAEAKELRDRIGAEVVLTVDSTWGFLGFDVMDEGTCVSGLSNCGYREEEVEALRAVWAPRLNERGLFDSLDEAFAFRELTDARVPEHAPFTVYGIWLVPRGSP